MDKPTNKPTNQQTNQQTDRGEFYWTKTKARRLRRREKKEGKSRVCFQGSENTLTLSQAHGDTHRSVGPDAAMVVCGIKNVCGS